MPRSTPDLILEEISGDQYPDLAAAQQAALKATAADLVKILRSLLASGILLQVNGRIIRNPDKQHPGNSCAYTVKSP
jgi:hypothetical protein